MCVARSLVIAELHAVFKIFSLFFLFFVPCSRLSSLVPSFIVAHANISYRIVGLVSSMEILGYVTTMGWEKGGRPYLPLYTVNDHMALDYLSSRRRSVSLNYTSVCTPTREWYAGHDDHNAVISVNVNRCEIQPRYLYNSGEAQHLPLSPTDISWLRYIAVLCRLVKLAASMAVCPVSILTVTHKGAACDAACLQFGPTIRRTDILVQSYCPESRHRQTHTQRLGCSIWTTKGVGIIKR